AVLADIAEQVDIPAVRQSDVEASGKTPDLLVTGVGLRTEVVKEAVRHRHRPVDRAVDRGAVVRATRETGAVRIGVRNIQRRERAGEAHFEFVARIQPIGLKGDARGELLFESHYRRIALAAGNTVSAQPLVLAVNGGREIA